EYIQSVLANNPEMLQDYLKGIADRKEILPSSQNRQSGGDETYVIPVVVHIVYSATTQNVTDEQVLSQIEVLNEDYNRLNDDADNTPSEFEDNAGSANVEFKLAQYDEDGNPTTGITRTETDISSWNLFAAASADNYAEKVKSTDDAGIDGWDRDCYLNIWVCNLSGGILGFSSFPDFGIASRDGVVICYKYFGRDGTAFSPFDKGRTATHEVGHWLGLYHIWGDDGGTCSGSDDISDTPNQAEETYFCPSFPTTDACSPLSPGIMFMNYMDYTDDDCMNMFTEGQVDEMRNILETDRESLITCTIPFTEDIVNINGNLIDADIYPNPTEDGNFYVYIKNPVEKELMLQIYTIDGHLIYTVNENAAAEHTINIDLHDHANGIYLVKIFDGYNYFTKQIVIAK
ncbi:MAG: T9SS type A sorting domain-containing protein, partial [Fimbriimonadaceae bacterium]|nr:T9SS type A sorting domain-containing protein [Chitinophagales bacterium]